jgi:hypothetical protein
MKGLREAQDPTGDDDQLTDPWGKTDDRGGGTPPFSSDGVSVFGWSGGCGGIRLTTVDSCWPDQIKGTVSRPCYYS